VAGAVAPRERVAAQDVPVRSPEGDAAQAPGRIPTLSDVRCLSTARLVQEHERVYATAFASRSTEIPVASAGESAYVG
jgi:hypothetical protein